MYGSQAVVGVEGTGLCSTGKARNSCTQSASAFLRTVPVGSAVVPAVHGQQVAYGHGCQIFADGCRKLVGEEEMTLSVSFSLPSEAASPTAVAVNVLLTESGCEAHPLSLRPSILRQ